MAVDPSVPLSPYDTKRPDGTINRFYPDEYYNGRDPNYNPNTFDWLMSGIKNPLDALNTAGMGVMRYLNDNPVAGAVANAAGGAGVGYSSNGGAHTGMAAPAPSAPAPGGVPSVGQIGADAVAWTKAHNPNASTFTVQPNASDVGYNTPLTPTYNSIPTSANPAGAAPWNDGAYVGPYGSNKDTTAPTSPGGQTTVPAAGSNYAQVPAAGSNVAAAPAPDGGGIWKHVAAAGAVAAPLVGGVIQATAAGSTADQLAQAQRDAAQLQAEQFQKVLDEQRRQYDTTREDQRAWRESGVGALGKLNSFETDNPNFGMEQFQQDPGYSFRLSEGMKALQNSAAARGGLMSGNTLKGISNYGQESASQEYNNAFNRYQAEKTGRANRYQSLAGVGQSAVNTTNAAGQNYANNAGNAMIGQGNALAGGITGAANARGSGYMGQANALSGALNGAMNNWTSNNMLNELRGGY